jgi:hypothetical protein
MDAAATTPRECQAGGSANTWAAATCPGHFSAGPPLTGIFCAAATGSVDGDVFIDTWYIKGSGDDTLKGPMDGNPCQDATMNDVNL